jgi:HNH endonuclease
MSACIYCGRDDAASISHIIPESLGSNTTLNQGVCDECNVGINREVEEPIIRSLAVLRSFFQLEGKRGKRTRLRIEARYGSGTYAFSASSATEVLSRAFVFRDCTDPNGVARKIAFVSFNQAAIEEHRNRYAPRHVDAPLTEIPSENLQGLEFWVDFDFGVFSDARCLRMIAKIAFEWWCRDRSPEFVSTDEYNDIRNYIRHGAEPDYPIVSVLDNAVVNGYLGAIPFGAHLLYRHSDRGLGSLVMAISPFGLVYYKVILTRHYRPLAANTTLTCVNPQTGDAYAPRLENPRGRILRLTAAVPADSSNATDVIRRISPRLLERLNQGMKDIIEQSGSQARGADTP